MKHLSFALVALTGIFFTIMANTDNTHEEHDHAEDEVCTDACALPSHAETHASAAFEKTDAEWEKILEPDQFRVMRKQGTEPPFRNLYWDNKDKGVYLCAGCDAPLFASKEKFDSGTGWPSFYDSIEKQYIGKTVDVSYGMKRTEVHCSRCGGHLGHIFEDGPKPTNLRYCINSASIEFVKTANLESLNLEAYKEHAQ